MMTGQGRVCWRLLLCGRVGCGEEAFGDQALLDRLFFLDRLEQGLLEALRVFGAYLLLLQVLETLIANCVARLVLAPHGRVVVRAVLALQRELVGNCQIVVAVLYTFDHLVETQAHEKLAVVRVGNEVDVVLGWLGEFDLGEDFFVLLAYHVVELGFLLFVDELLVVRVLRRGGRWGLRRLDKGRVGRLGFS